MPRVRLCTNWFSGFRPSACNKYYVSGNLPWSAFGSLPGHNRDRCKTRPKRLQVTLFWKVPQLPEVIKIEYKRSIHQGLVKDSHGSNTLCQTLWENCQSVQRQCFSAQDCKEFMSFTIHSSAKGRNQEPVVLFEKPSWCYHDGHSHMSLGVLWKIIVSQHSLPLHQ